MPQNDYTYNLPQTLIPSITVYGQSHPCELLYLKPTLSGEGGVHCVPGGGGETEVATKSVRTGLAREAAAIAKDLEGVAKVQIGLMLNVEDETRAVASANWNGGRPIEKAGIRGFVEAHVGDIRRVLARFALDLISQSDVLGSSPANIMPYILERMRVAMGRKVSHANSQADVDTVVEPKVA